MRPCWPERPPMSRATPKATEAVAARPFSSALVLLLSCVDVSCLTLLASDRDEVLAAAPEVEDAQFKVPPVLGESR